MRIDQLPECPWAREYLPGGDKAPDMDDRNRFVRACLDDENFFVAEAPAGKHGKWSYLELWHIHPGSFPRAALRHAVLRKSLYGIKDGGDEPIHAFDNRLRDFLIEMDASRTTFAEIARRRDAANKVFDAEHAEHMRKMREDCAGDNVKLLSQSTPRVTLDFSGLSGSTGSTGSAESETTPIGAVSGDTAGAKDKKRKNSKKD